MKIYSVKFNSYDGGPLHSLNEPKTVSKTVDGKKFIVKTSKNGDFLIPEFDLQKYESFGGGYEYVKIVGHLDDKYFLGISIKEVEEALETIVSEEIKSIELHNQAQKTIKPIPTKEIVKPNKPLKKYEIRLLSSEFGIKPVGIIEATNESKAWEIAKEKYSNHKGHLNVRPAL
jgi:hypothetical protein